MLLDRSGEGKVYSLIKGRRFEQLNVLESQNILLTISGKKNKIVKTQTNDGKKQIFLIMENYKEQNILKLLNMKELNFYLLN